MKVQRRLALVGLAVVILVIPALPVRVRVLAQTFELPEGWGLDLSGLENLTITGFADFEIEELRIRSWSNSSGCRNANLWDIYIEHAVVHYEGDVVEGMATLRYTIDFKKLNITVNSQNRWTVGEEEEERRSSSHGSISWKSLSMTGSLEITVKETPEASEVEIVAHGTQPLYRWIIEWMM